MLLAVLGVFSWACSPAPTVGSEPAPTLQAAPIPSHQTPLISPQLTTANTQFGFKLLTQLLAQDSQRNIFVSPPSVAIALAMTYNGANGATQTAMATALQLNGLTLADLNQANANLQAALSNPEPQVQLTIANSLWAKQGVTFKPDFLARTQAAYTAQITELDFTDPGAPNTINAWVKETTQGKIGKIIDRLNPDNVMFLINAIYFNGKWATEFDKNLTTEQPFYLLDGTPKLHPLMMQSDRYPYYETEQFQAVSLPYGSGRMSLYIFLPKSTSSLAAFYQTLTAAQWQTWMGQFRKQQGTVRIPKFQLAYEVELKSALSALGMGIAFDANQADFSNLSEMTTYIDQVKHKTFVEVNEAGTEAAAVTSVGVSVTSVMPDGPFQITVDRPFFFAIRDNQTETVLFMGSIVDPQ
jgi:serine protease inhibitor